MNKEWIVNLKTKQYMEVDRSPDMWDGEWRDRYPHTRAIDYEQIATHRIDASDMSAGIPYTYSLCRDGGYFTLLVDVDKNTPEQIKQAQAELRRDHDVVCLYVVNLKKYNEGRN